VSAWQRWLDNLEKSRAREVLFQIHYWMGTVAGAYIFLMSITGSMMVFRNQISRRYSLAWLADLHENLFLGSTGRLMNGVGAICLTLLCVTGAVIWWPGYQHWRRSLTVSWNLNFPRINWDLHSALGFWCFLFVSLWGLSGIYLIFPQLFNVLLLFDRKDRFTDAGLYWLSALHFGRFGWFTETIWALLGLVPAILAFTGFFICCRRVILGKSSNPKHV
jgi:uncharacterized iron-regulated membrane protein